MCTPYTFKYCLLSACWAQYPPLNAEYPSIAMRPWSSLNGVSVLGTSSNFLPSSNGCNNGIVDRSTPVFTVATITSIALFRFLLRMSVEYGSRLAAISAVQTSWSRTTTFKVISRAVCRFFCKRNAPSVQHICPGCGIAPQRLSGARMVGKLSHQEGFADFCGHQPEYSPRYKANL